VSQGLETESNDANLVSAYYVNPTVNNYDAAGYELRCQSENLAEIM
jgi:hypothetical protein